MAEKKTAASEKSTAKSSQQPSAKSPQEATAKISIPQELLDKLRETEKKALEELEAGPKGTGKTYRLSDPNTQYVDTRTGWTLAKDQAKPIPENYTAETIARIREGFLVEVSESSDS